MRTSPQQISYNLGWSWISYFCGLSFSHDLYYLKSTENLVLIFQKLYLFNHNSDFSGSRTYDLIETRRILLCGLFPSLVNIILYITCLSVCIAANKSEVTRNLKPNFWGSTYSPRIASKRQVVSMIPLFDLIMFL